MMAGCASVHESAQSVMVERGNIGWDETLGTLLNS